MLVNRKAARAYRQNFRGRIQCPGNLHKRRDGAKIRRGGEVILRKYGIRFRQPQEEGLNSGAGVV